VKHVWRAYDMEEVRVILVEKNSAREVVQCILEMKERKQILVVSLLWQWLLERDRVREGGKKETGK
jgi:hypothetical protein